MDLSIIIINFNTVSITKECLDSIRKNTKGITYEIIVVDNASTDGSKDMLKKYSRRFGIKVIMNKINRGFGPGNNQGIKISKGDFILLLNTDTIIHDEVLSKMCSFLKGNKKIGIATCALRNKDGSLQGSGGYFPTLFKVIAWMFFLEDVPLLDSLIKPFHPVHGQSPFYKGTNIFTKKHQQDWVTGAFMMIRRKVCKQIGSFDEDYFMYTEEVDYCWRAKKAGWEVWYEPSFSITHLGGASSTAEFPILSEYKGIKMFYKKHQSIWQFWLLRFFLKIGALLRIFLFGILKGREAVKTYAKALEIA